MCAHLSNSSYINKWLIKCVLMLMSLHMSSDSQSSIYGIGLRAYLGTVMRLSLLMWRRNRFPLNQHLVVQVTRKETLQIRIVTAGKLKVIGRKIGGKPTQEKDSLHSLLSILTGAGSIFIFTETNLLRKVQDDKVDNCHKENMLQKSFKNSGSTVSRNAICLKKIKKKLQGKR